MGSGRVPGGLRFAAFPLPSRLCWGPPLPAGPLALLRNATRKSARQHGSPRFALAGDGQPGWSGFGGARARSGPAPASPPSPVDAPAILATPSRPSPVGALRGLDRAAGPCRACRGCFARGRVPPASAVGPPLHAGGGVTSLRVLWSFGPCTPVCFFPPARSGLSAFAWAWWFMLPCRAPG